VKVICAWCRAVIKDGPDEPVSHGMCPACFASQSALYFGSSSAVRAGSDDFATAGRRVADADEPAPPAGLSGNDETETAQLRCKMGAMEPSPSPTKTRRRTPLAEYLAATA